MHVDPLSRLAPALMEAKTFLPPPPEPAFGRPIEGHIAGHFVFKHTTPEMSFVRNQLLLEIGQLPEEVFLERVDNASFFFHNKLPLVPWSCPHPLWKL